MESIEQTWIVTQRMAGEVKKAGFAVDSAVNRLRSAKAMLNECRLDEHARAELLPKASALIEDAQREIVSTAEPLGTDFTEKWTAELKRALMGEKIGEFTVEGSSKFYSNMPRDRKWVRVAIPESVKKELEGIGDRAGAEIRPDGDSHVIIAGEKASIRKALDEISPYFKMKR